MFYDAVMTRNSHGDRQTAEIPSNQLLMSEIGKILIVDDEIELKSVLVESLSSHGYETVGVTSGEQALAKLRSETFDIVLTDLMMPGIDGITLVQEALQIDPHLVCIVMTGQGTIQTAVDAMKVGSFDYVLKPFRLQTLIPILTRAMSVRQMRLENLQLRETVTIYELAQTIALTLDSETVLNKLVEAVLKQTDADQVSVLLPVEDETGDLYVAAVRGPNRERLLGQRVPLKETISGWVASQRQPLILKGAVNDTRFRPVCPHPEITSSISIPMQVANKVVGTININAVNRLRPFTIAQMKVLTVLAGTAAAALESASLYTQVRRAEENYRSIFENAVEGIFQATAEREFITVNPSMARILGYESPEEVMTTFTDVSSQLYVNPSLADQVTRTLEEEGIVQGFEFEAYRKDREKIWLSLNIRLIRDQDGKALLREGTIEDITEHKRAEGVLRETVRSKAESLALLDTILSTAPIGFAFHNRQYEFERINESLAAINGLPVDQHLGRPLREVLPDMAPVLEPLMQHVMDLDQPVIDIELIGQTPADPDQKRYWLMSFYPVRMQGGEILGVGVLVTDVTARKQAEQDLRESEERYRDLFENAHDIIYTLDLEGKFTSINKAGKQITGYSREEALDLNISQIIVPDDLVRVNDMIQRKLAGEAITAYEMDILAKDGRRVSIEVNTRLILNGGQPAGIQGIARDVTERKHLEEQLRQSQKMEAIGQLAGGVAHDFNNLLTAINGYSSLALQRNTPDERMKSYLEEIRKAGDRAANLTRQLLAFGRKQMLKPVALNLNDVVSDMNRMLRRLIGEDIRFEAKLDPELTKIKADAGQIEQVLVNLVVNSRDAMPQGGTLTIETMNFEVDHEYVSKHLNVPAGQYVMLAVSDTGCGMNLETKARIFEPFFTTKEKGRGTGLGLSTVYGIVKQSGGNIWVYSEPGKGTTFKVYLPQLESHEETMETPSVETSSPGGSETILLVEDEDVVRGLARQILEQAGYKVLDASGGEEAIRLCHEHADPIHLLLSDVVMPETSGKEIAKRLTSLRPGTRVLFMSGYTDDAIVHHGVLDSDVEFIQKPFTPLALAKKVREVLDLNGFER